MFVVVVSTFPSSDQDEANVLCIGGADGLPFTDLGEAQIAAGLVQVEIETSGCSHRHFVGVAELGRFDAATFLDAGPHEG